MSGRGTLYLLLTVVAGAAAMLSFAALRDLAELCGFGSALSWLLPVVVDAGAAAGSLVWLGARTGEPARQFARRLALGLLSLSVAANALGHGLAAYLLAPPWWVVVVLSGIAPAVLGAMVHLAVLVGHEHRSSGSIRSGAVVDDEPIPYELVADPDPADALDRPVPSGRRVVTPPEGLDPPSERAIALIAAGAGRRRLSRELDITEYEARRLLERVCPTGDDPAPATAEPTEAGVPTSTGAGA